MTTNVLLSIDAATIYKTFKSTATTADKPQPVGAAHVSVMTSDGNTTSQNVTDIAVEEGEDFMWWVQSAGLYTCVIYNFIDAKTGQTITSDIISPPALKHFGGQLLVDGRDPNNPKFQGTQVYCWSADAQNTGTLSYGIQFSIYDHTGKALGFYQFVGAASTT